MATLTRKGLALLLSNLDPIPNRAFEKYEGLRLRLIQFFILSRDCPEVWADALADKTLDRVALKLEQGTLIEQLRAFTLTTARYIWLENKDRIHDGSLSGELPDIPDETQPEEPDEIYMCLMRCLDAGDRDKTDREILLKYYDAAEGEKNKDHRKQLAQSLGIRYGALKVRACRLRKALERCIKECLKNRAAL